MDKKATGLNDLYDKFRENVVPGGNKKLFISYSRMDKEFADRISLALMRYGQYLWIDRIEMTEILSEQEIDERLRHHIREADGVILLLSPNSVRSSWVQIEYREALKAESAKKESVLIPAIIEECQVPDILDRPCIDFRAGFDSAVLDIVAKFGTSFRARRSEPYVSSRPCHTNLGVTSNTTAVMAYNIGIMDFHKGNVQSALSHWERAIELAPDFADALYNSACVLYELAMEKSKKGTEDSDAILTKVIDKYESLDYKRG